MKGESKTCIHCNGSGYCTSKDWVSVTERTYWIRKREGRKTFHRFLSNDFYVLGSCKSCAARLGLPDNSRETNNIICSTCQGKGSYWIGLGA